MMNNLKNHRNVLAPVFVVALLVAVLVVCAKAPCTVTVWKSEVVIECMKSFAWLETGIDTMDVTGSR